MGVLTAAEVAASYSKSGVDRATKPIWRMVCTGLAAGAIIAIGGVVTNTAAHSLTNVGMIRLVCGLLFPFGLSMLILLGMDLFTGNMLLSISVLDKKITLQQMLRNVCVVYLANLVGAMLVAAGCAYFGQMNYSGGGLAVFNISTAIAKCSIPFANGVVLGIFCNALVCVGILMSLCATDVPGRIMGAFTPVAFFVICGFEHCVANMYYIPAGIFAMNVPEYAQLAVDAGLNVSALTWRNFFIGNLLPVTIGNIIGGVLVGLYMWGCHIPRQKVHEQKLDQASKPDATV